MEEKNIITGMSQGGSAFEKALSSLYTSATYKHPIISFFLSKGLPMDEAQLLWSDVVIHFSKIIKAGKYKDEGKLGGYLRNTANFLLLNYFRRTNKKQHNELTEIILNKEVHDDVPYYSKELKEVLEEQLHRLGGACQEILKMWSLSYSMKEIADKLSLVSAEATRKRKHLCFKKLLESVRSNPELKATLHDYLDL
jgi:RNA polymerase sigma factor (sigma-70 family)